MAISFKCPGCGNFCAFAEKYANRRATCLNCGRKLVIPAGDGQEAVLVKENNRQILPGFYKNVLTGWIHTFLHIQSLAGVVAVSAAVFFMFFFSNLDFSFTLPGFRVQLPIGLIMVIFIKGSLYWYYMEIISAAADGEDVLVEPDIGSGFEFIFNVIKSIYFFVVALILAELPFWILIALLEAKNINITIVNHGLVLIGLFIFPIVILMIITARELWMVFRVDQWLKPIIKAPCAYLFSSSLLVIGWSLSFYTKEYYQIENDDKLIIALWLCANLGNQFLIIIAMRAIGLFFLHYNRYMDWVDEGF